MARHCGVKGQKQRTECTEDKPKYRIWGLCSLVTFTRTVRTIVGASEWKVTGAKKGLRPMVSGWAGPKVFTSCSQGWSYFRLYLCSKSSLPSDIRRLHEGDESVKS